MIGIIIIIICTVLFSWYFIPFMTNVDTIDDDTNDNINMKSQTSTEPTPRRDWGGQYTCQKFDCNT